MNNKYLFPHRYKKIGWIILIPSILFGLFTIITNFEPAFLDLKVFSISGEGKLFSEGKFFSLAENNILNEILGVLVIISSLFVAFSKEEQEDEYISKIRLESLVWATYINYGILILAFLFFYGFSFLWVMLFNMFTILIFFIIIFNWQLRRMRKYGSYEE